MISFAKKGFEQTTNLTTNITTNLKKKALPSTKKKPASIDPFSNDVPLIIDDIVRYIEENGMEEGLFRTPGNKKDVQLILSSFAKGKKLDLQRFGAHACASALKQYLANLSYPLLTNELLNCFMLAIEVKLPNDDSERATLIPNLHSIKSAVDLLPPGNREVLKRICHMLRKISENSNCKLSTTELAVALSPVIFPREHSNVVKYIEDSQKAHSLVETFISNYPVIFLNEKTPSLETNKNNKFMLKLHRSSVRLGNNLQLRLQKLKELQEEEEEEEEEKENHNTIPSSAYMKVVSQPSKDVLKLSTTTTKDWIFTISFFFFAFVPYFYYLDLSGAALTICLLFVTYTHLPSTEICEINRNEGNIKTYSEKIFHTPNIRVHDLNQLNDVIVEKNRKKKGAYRTVLIFDSGISVPLTESFYFHPRGIPEKDVASKILNFIKIKE